MMFAFYLMQALLGATAPLLLVVQRLPGDKPVTQQDSEPYGWRQQTAGIRPREEALEAPVQPQQESEMVDDRQSPHHLRLMPKFVGSKRGLEASVGVHPHRGKFRPQCK